MVLFQLMLSVNNKIIPIDGMVIPAILPNPPCIVIGHYANYTPDGSPHYLSWNSQVTIPKGLYQCKFTVFVSAANTRTVGHTSFNFSTQGDYTVPSGFSDTYSDIAYMTLGSVGDVSFSPVLAYGVSGLAATTTTATYSHTYVLRNNSSSNYVNFTTLYNGPNLGGVVVFYTLRLTQVNN